MNDRLDSHPARRLERALTSLDGLSIGDGFGECFLSGSARLHMLDPDREPPPPPWIVTDDTLMALSIVRCLREHGRIDPDHLARRFADEYAREPGRGYGRGAHQILAAIARGTDWREAAGQAFDGRGSCGNGGAMRSAPVGAYFADDLDQLVCQARVSAEVTHAHPDGQTGAIAVALAAGWMARMPALDSGYQLIEFVLEHLPRTETHHALKRALAVPLDTIPLEAAMELGNGAKVTASDTVPFCLWCAARHPGDFGEALWASVSGLGDVDTTCAIVGGIVATGIGRDRIPPAWLNAREPIEV